jgi:hypothetical protein
MAESSPKACRAALSPKNVPLAHHYRRAGGLAVVTGVVAPVLRRPRRLAAPPWHTPCRTGGALNPPTRRLASSLPALKPQPRLQSRAQDILPPGPQLALAPLAPDLLQQRHDPQLPEDVQERTQHGSRVHPVDPVDPRLLELQFAQQLT